MFDKYMILEHSFKNVVENGQVIGFEFGARIPYYRGLGISMIEEIAVSIDGVTVPRESIRVNLHGNTYSLDEMALEYEDRWELGEVGTVRVLQEGGLDPGEHRIELKDRLRISYLPFPLMGQDSKMVMLES